jgi:hypothetical protein
MKRALERDDETIEAAAKARAEAMQKRQGSGTSVQRDGGMYLKRRLSASSSMLSTPEQPDDSPSGIRTPTDVPVTLVYSPSILQELKDSITDFD